MVRYIPPGRAGVALLWRILRQTPHDLLYLNSFFDPVTAFLPMLWRRLGLAPGRPVVVAPRGQFSPGALELKMTRKHLYLGLTRAIGLWSGAWFHATSEIEAADIERELGSVAARRTIVAPNLSARVADSVAAKPPKRPGELKVVFLSRITRKKNLLGAIRMLNGLPGRITFDIYGPIEDQAYRRECEEAAAKLSPSVVLTWRGEVPHEQVAEILSHYHLFFLPTLGENFGHVIAEALGAGCPVLLSDRTPWRGLHPAGAGWDFPLEDAGLFRNVLEECVAGGEHRQQALRAAAMRLAQTTATVSADLEAYRSLLNREGG